MSIQTALLHRLCRLCKQIVIAVSALLVADMAFAQPSSGCETGHFRDFDFWAGKWIVHTGEDQLAGHNEITIEQGGCVLIERWTGSKGGAGVSMNVYYPEQKTWRQLWVSPGTLIDIEGGLVAGSMVLEGTINYISKSQMVAFRGTWTLLEDGRVRQFFEQLGEAGEWQTWFEGFYTRE